MAHLLDTEVEREPVSHRDRRFGHLYFVAQPISAPPALARGIARDDTRAAIGLVWDTEPTFRSQAVGAELPPNPRQAASRSHRSRGLGLSSHGPSGPGRSLRPNPNGGESDDGGLLDIELPDGGGIRLFVGRGTMSVGQTALGLPNALSAAWRWRTPEGYSTGQ